MAATGLADYLAAVGRRVHSGLNKLSVIETQSKKALCSRSNQAVGPVLVSSAPWYPCIRFRAVVAATISKVSNAPNVGHFGFDFFGFFGEVAARSGLHLSC